MSLSCRLYQVTLRWRRFVTRFLYAPLFGRIGAGTTIFRPALLLGTEHIYIGDRVLIRPGARLEIILRDGVRPCIEIGDDVSIEQNVHIVCQTRVTIGARVSLTGGAAIVDVTHPHEAVIEGTRPAAARADDMRAVTIGDDSFIGYGAVILPGVTIGRGCMIGANSVVSRDIPDYSVAAGAPARILRTSAGSPQTKKNTPTS